MNKTIDRLVKRIEQEARDSQSFDISRIAKAYGFGGFKSLIKDARGCYLTSKSLFGYRKTPLQGFWHDFYDVDPDELHDFLEELLETVRGNNTSIAECGDSFIGGHREDISRNNYEGRHDREPINEWDWEDEEEAHRRAEEAADEYWENGGEPSERQEELDDYYAEESELEEQNEWDEYYDRYDGELPDLEDVIEIKEVSSSSDLGYFQDLFNNHPEAGIDPAIREVVCTNESYDEYLNNFTNGQNEFFYINSNATEQSLKDFFSRIDIQDELLDAWGCEPYPEDPAAQIGFSVLDGRDSTDIYGGPVLVIGDAGSVSELGDQFNIIVDIYGSGENYQETLSESKRPKGLKMRYVDMTDPCLL